MLAASPRLSLCFLSHANRWSTGGRPRHHHLHRAGLEGPPECNKPGSCHRCHLSGIFFFHLTEPIYYSVHQLYPPQFRIVEVARVQKTASPTSAILARLRLPSVLPVGLSASPSQVPEVASLMRFTWMVMLWLTLDFITRSVVMLKPIPILSINGNLALTDFTVF